MSIVDQLIAQIGSLSPELRQSLLARLGESHASLPPGRPGTEILNGVLRIDDESAREMMEAIEEDCEKVDVSQW